MKKESLPAWDLKDLYTSPDDNRIKKNHKLVQAKIESFLRKHRTKVKRLNAKDLHKALKEYENILVLVLRPIEYAALYFAEDASNLEAQAFYQQAQANYVALSKNLIFFELELSNLPLKRLKRFISHASLINYKRYLQKLLIHKKFQLPEAEEKLLKEASLTGRSAFGRLFDQEFAYKLFTYKVKGKSEKLSETEVLHKLSNKDRKIRKAAMTSLIEGLQSDAWRLTYIFNTLAEDKRLDDDRRGYEAPEDSRHLSNEISREVVTVLSDTVADHFSLVQSYTRFKQKLLGLSKFELYDRYAPLKGVEKIYTFDEGKNLVLKAFSKFSTQYSNLTKEFFDKKWIDAAKRPGKRGGAFCTYTTPDLHPYVFINYHGSLRDVFTLAHEFGHAAHGYLMRKQSYLNFDSPLTMAEMASTFAELLLFDFLKKRVRDRKQMLALYVFCIDNMIATVFRQIAMHRFERDFHEARRNEGELKPQDISALWQARQKEMYGNSLKFVEGSECLWSYIPHFVHSPFYVYAYSFGNLLALSLFSKYKAEGRGFVPKFLRMLSLGCSQSPDELVKPFGIELNSARTWQNALAMIEQFMEEAKALVGKKR